MEDWSVGIQDSVGRSGEAPRAKASGAGHKK